MKHLDLFSGIAGFALAARWMGWETVAFCERDKFCQQVIRKHWPDTLIYDDIHTLPTEFIRESFRPDIITGGFPCQPFSQAGQRRGSEDDRYLWPALLEVIKAIRPTWFVGENVAGIISLALDTVLSDLESAGYACQAVVIPAVAANAIHRRDRVWIIGYSEHSGLDAAKERISGGTGINGDTQGQNEVCQSSGSGVSRSNATDANRQPGTAGDNEWSEHLCHNGPEIRLEQCSSRENDAPHANTTRTQRPAQAGNISINGAQSNDKYVRRCDLASPGYTTSAGLPDWAGGEVGQPSPLTEFERPIGDGKEREVERDFRGVAHGVSRGVHRLRALGNAIVPQVAFEIFKAIEVANESRR